MLNKSNAFITTFVAILATGGILLAGCGGKVSPEEFCEQEIACFPDDWESQQECVSEVEAQREWAESRSSGCASAVDKAIACTTKLSCSELEAYWEESTDDYPCHKEDAAVEAACE